MNAAIIERLRELGALRLVDGAAAFQTAAETNPPATPAVYVLATKERAGPNELETGGIEQRVDVEIGIVLVVRNVSDTRGAAAGADMDAIREAVKASLYGWMPPGAAEGLERGQSGLLAFRDGHQWWQDTYKTAYYDRSQ